ncbi:unnamed protein product, partial [Allacma fusca]
LGDKLAAEIAQSRQENWQGLVEDLNFGKDSRRAWHLLKRLNGEKSQARSFTQTTANQIAHQLLINGKTNGRIKSKKIIRNQAEEVNNFSSPFTYSEVTAAIRSAKNQKAAGVDKMYVEQIKHFGPKTVTWIQELHNTCVETSKIPRSWRQAHVIAIQKPDKDPDDPKSYCPILLLCHLYKIFERVVLNRVAEHIDKNLISQQTGFRPGKSCTSQVLSLTQHIEDGFEQRKVTGAVFVDLTAAFDTVCHWLLWYKIYELTKHYKFTEIITTLLKDRRFYVTLDGKNSTWRKQKNGLPQGSVLSPILFNIYTNNQPIGGPAHHFLYADDLALTAQCDTFIEVEDTLNQAIEELDKYYKANHLRPNPSKTETCLFHLQNCEAKRQLNIQWGNTALNHNDHPKYLGVTLDRSLTYKQHCEKTKMKVAARTNLIRKLVAHAKKVDVPLNEACRLVTGCLRPTPLTALHCLAGIAPPEVNREVAARAEKTKATHNPLHPMHGYNELPESRLKSRHSFLRIVNELSAPAEVERCQIWNTASSSNTMSESLPQGNQLKYSLWKTLNRIRSGTTHSKSNLHRWHLADDNLCKCGEVQDDRHLFRCRLYGDFDADKLDRTIDDEGMKFLEYWDKKGI